MFALMMLVQFRFHEAAVAIEKAVSRSQFEDWIDPEVSEISGCIDRLQDLQRRRKTWTPSS